METDNFNPILSKNELESLAAERPESTFEIFTPNDFYGHASILKKYCGLSDSYQLPGILSHGIYLRGQVWDAEVTHSLPFLLLLSKHQVDIYSKHTTKHSEIIGSPFMYAYKIIQNELKLIKKFAQGTVVFPSHSTHYITAQYDQKAFIQYLKITQKEKGPLTICLYWRDIQLGRHIEYLNEGFNCTTAGHLYDKEFIFRLLRIICSHKYVVTNELSSSSFYSAAMSLPVFFYEQKIMRNQAYLDQPSHLLQVSNEPFLPIVEDFYNTKKDSSPNAFVRQKEIAQYLLGYDSVLEPNELKKLFEFLWQKIQEKLCSVDHINLQAKQALQNGDIQRAKELLTKVLSQSPNNIKALNNLAVTKILEKDWNSALNTLQKILNLDPFNKVALENVKYLETQVPLHKSFLEVKNYLPQNTKQQSKSTSLLLADEEFNKLLQVIQPYTMLSNERLYSLFSLAKKVCETNIPGNFVECGVAAGGSIALLAYVIKKYSKQPRWLYAFDSFNDMPFPTEYDRHNGHAANATGWGAGTCAAPEDSVKDICTKLGVTEILKTIKGDFHDTLPKMRDTVGMIAFLHMDGDWYESTKAVLHNLYDRIINYGLVQIDDYGYWEGCKRAVHEFEKLRNISFTLNKIDGTGIWFKKPEVFPVNHTLSPLLINDFYNDDPAPRGLMSQMSTNERFQLYYVIRNLLPRKDVSPLRFIEIGSYAGASLFLIYMAIKIFTPTIQGFAIEPGKNAQLNEVIKVIGDEVNLLPIPSQQAAPYLLQLFKKDNNFPKLIFVDGNHTYDGVRQDIINYFSLLAPGGIMVFHDYLPPLNKGNRDAILFHHAGNEPGVQQACQELMENTFQCEVLNIPLLYPTDPTQTQAHLPIIPNVFSTIRVYRKSIAGNKGWLNE